LKYPKLSGQSVVVVSDKQASYPVSEGVTVFNTATGVFYSLNSVGALVWHLVQKPQRIEDINLVILREFDIDPGVCLSDLLELLQDMANSGLLVIETDPSDQPIV
jgi:hypothetical protein